MSGRREEQREVVREYVERNAASRKWWRDRVLDLGRQGHPVWVIQERTNHHFDAGHVGNLLREAGIPVVRSDE